ncbi:serine/threonine-protein kinase [Streptomonospora sp. DSM 45055]|uniref:Serine/threonine-protein kinase n=1 Tax=Streptomonospora wellingtoniae TaxID=3075544 RepID=A0ABU2KY92_9ACTN|nr:serine/threonine-protein kinase [Streptomonospora sp. DSM 45055]MDT0304277.1 serine/threonine-protein kinase [Streptomonospora sp. DSM 45055]
MEDLAPADPRALGGITLRGRLGEGGMGRVYAGFTEDGEYVAVKVLLDAHAERKDLRGRFAREIAAMQMVQDPGTAALLDAASPDDDPPWLAMEFVRGLSLRDYVQRYRPLGAESGAALGLVLADALDAIHAAGLLHRDLKPSNVLMGPEGPRVIDFGLVALGGPGGELTTTGATVGTPVCMAPEQADSPADVTAAADVYGLGATLLYAATGHYPYQRPAIPAVIAALTSEDVPPDLDGAPAELSPLIARMLAHAPAGRPPLTEVRRLLAERLAVSGRSPAAARTALARETYVPGADEPDDRVIARPVRRPRHVGRTRSQMPNTPVVVRTAERLRRAYA